MEILIIEPDHVLSKIYKHALEAEGYKVGIAAGAQGAISYLDNHSIDLIIVELQLVEHNGIEFLYEFRSYSEWQNIPIIVHTMVPSNVSERSKLRGFGVVDYLYKPSCSLKQLVSAVEEFTAISRA